MKIYHGGGPTEYGPGVQVDLTGEEVARAILAYIVARGVHIEGPKTIRVNGEMLENGGIYVDPSGFVITKKGKKISGRGSASVRLQP